MYKILKLYICYWTHSTICIANTYYENNEW